MDKYLNFTKKPKFQRTYFVPLEGFKPPIICSEDRCAIRCTTGAIQRTKNPTLNWSGVNLLKPST